MIKYILCALLGYFAGCFSPSYLLSRRRGFDIRTFGSGNAGATNMMLAAGLKPGLVVMALDVSKAFVVTLPLRLLLPPLCAALAGLLCVLGHIFPVFLRFRGGKGTACLCGTVLGLTPELVLPLHVAQRVGRVDVGDLERESVEFVVVDGDFGQDLDPCGEPLPGFCFEITRNAGIGRAPDHGARLCQRHAVIAPFLDEFQIAVPRIVDFDLGDLGAHPDGQGKTLVEGLLHEPL